MMNIGRLFGKNIREKRPNHTKIRKKPRKPLKYAEYSMLLSLQSSLVEENRPAMNKAELIESVQSKLGKDATKRAAEDAVAAVLEAIATGVKKDKKVQLIGFGTFEVKNRAARMGRNPKTGEAMKIAASKSVGFKPSSTLKKSL